MEDKEEKQNYVYFIVTHNKSKKIKISLSQEYKGAETLELLVDKDMTKINDSLATEIYRFKLLPESLSKKEGQKEYEIEVIAEEENGNQDKYIIYLKDLQKNKYEYNFSIPKLEIQPLTVYDQFDIYVEILRDKLKKKQSTKENEDLILSTQALIVGPNKKYEFLFFLSIFLECFSTKFAQRHIILFKPSKIEGLGKVSDDKIVKLRNVLNLIYKKSEKLLHLEKESERPKIAELYFFVVLYFNHHFNQKEIPEMFKNEKTLEYLSKKLLEFKELYQGLVIPKNILIELFKQAKNFEEILSYLSFAGKNTIDFLDIINQEKELIAKYLDEELNKMGKEDKKDKKDKPIIEIEKYVEPKREDNISKLREIVEQINIFQSEKEKIVKFSPSVFEKYTEIFDKINLDYLFEIKSMIETIKRTDKKFSLNPNINIDQKIHDYGLDSVGKGKLKNKELLEFINKDAFYHEKEYEKKIYRKLDILNGIDISSINEEFFKNWKKINFYKMFENQINDFYTKISLFINDMKDFNLLFSFYIIYQDKEYKYDSIVHIQQRYKEIFPTYTDDEKCPNFINDTIKLIYLSDKNKVSIRKFLEEFLQKNLDVEKVNKIYIQLIKDHQDISQDLKNIIVKHFTENKNNATPVNLLNILKICKKLRTEIFSNINKFLINEKEFLLPEETENYKFFKALVTNGLLEEANQYKGALYISKATKAISSLEEKIKNDEINYNILSLYFQNEKDNKMEKVLQDRLLIIYLLDENKAKTTFESIKEKIIKIKEYIKNLELIYRDYADFYYISHPQDIENISKICFNLKNKELNYFEKNVKNDYEKYLKHLQEAKKRDKKKNSIFFNEIFKDAQNKFKNDDEKRLKETENKFKQFTKLFEPEGIYKIDHNLLELCLKPFRDNEQNLLKELNTLMTIFEIKEPQSLEKIHEETLLISQKSSMFNAAAGINVFIEKINAKKTKFSEEIKDIIMKLKGKNDINNLKYCQDKLIELKIIDKKEEDNKYINILMKFKEQPDSIIFLLENSLQEIGNLQELASGNDNNYVTVNDIMDMGKCLEFFKELKLESKKDFEDKTDSEIIYLLKEKVPTKKDIFLYFEKYVQNYAQIKMLKTSLDKSEVLKFKIQAIFNGSTFVLSNKKDESFKCEYMENVKEELKKVELTREDVISLRERALLAKKLTPDYKFFIESISEVINISNMLEEICMKGYPEYIVIKIMMQVKIIYNEDINKEMELDIKKEYYIDEKSKKDFKEVRDELKNILTILNDKLTNAYETKDLVRFIYGRQFSLLYNNFINVQNNNVSPLLKYVTDDLYKNEVTDFKRQEKGDIIENCINDSEKYLQQVLEKNGLSLDKLYQSTIIKKKFSNMNLKGMFTYYGEKLEKEMFQIYKCLTGNNPIAQNILLCNKETKNEEITAFLYRAVLCKYNSCFIIGGLELLDNEQKTCIINLLNHLYDNRKFKYESCVIFLYTSKDSDIAKSLENRPYKNNFQIKGEFKSEKYEGTNIEIIKSDKSGVGKSTQIKNDIMKKNKKWIYFPFGGVFTREDIIKRLKELQIDSNCVLHLDLCNTDLITLMMEFLFSMLITRFYGHNEDFFYLSKNIEIKVEIPNTFIDFFEKFPILTLFPIKEMKISQLAPLIVPPQLDSNIQIVANYLKCLKEDKINNSDLIFPNITPDYFESRTYKDRKKKICKTAIKAELLPPEKCQELIFETIREGIKEPTYYQITSFVDVLALQLRKLNKNIYINAFQLIVSNNPNNRLVRQFIVQNFIKITKHFTEGAFTDLLKGQEIVHKTLFGDYKEEEDLNKAVEELAAPNQKTISFKDIDPSLIFFHEGDNDESFSIITNKKKEEKEYKDLLSLINSQFERNDTKNMKKALKNYKSFTNNTQFLTELKEILDIKNPVEKEDNNPRISLSEIAGNYVFTADNFAKMILILLRIRANIPVIMMGETGCGKTSLIRKLSELKNNGDSNKMKVLNIHAGTTDNDIIEFLNEKVIPEAKEIAEAEREEKEKRMKINQFFDETKIWVFLDEINTCKSMGLITELMCKHSYQGKSLPSNIVFIAACNPYRKREKKDNEDVKKVGLDINQAHKQLKYLNAKELAAINRAQNSDLVYTVHPLPHSLLNFVFNFGSLEEEDEKNYIRCIIKEAINKKYYKEQKPKEEKKEDKELTKLKNLASDMIIQAQEFIKKFNDKSAVSLREIRRFNIFYEFFYEYLKKRKEIYETEKKNLQFDVAQNDFYLNLNDYHMQVYAINLSVFVCYYLRITNKDKRHELYLIMNKLFTGFSPEFNQKDFLELPLQEERFIVENIKLDKGIAKNRALLENIFSLFVAINNKVPIFIVGKPGCSKSLSVQLITKSMQGSASDSHFFKNLPKLMVHSFQGSMASTSKGVENIFKKARSVYKDLPDNEKPYNIPLIFFDEMGLAEHSPNNPLKVIHAALEYDQNEGDNKVAFIGISNWVLDAAKMNRGISISIPEPDEEDNKETSLTIGKSYDELLAKRYKGFYESLGKSYFDYKQYLKKNHNSDKKEDFHGNRDFYHLVKNSSRNMLDKEKQNQLDEVSLLDSAVSSIERNFSGIQFDEKKTSLEIFKAIFKEMYPECKVAKEYDVLQRIKDNIEDLYSRYLLVISKSSISTFLLSSILSDTKKEYSFYLGSQFEEDLNSEVYTLKVLNKIQSHMERGNILILKNLEDVYPAMYDLFNQNFTVVSNKNYSRLAIGSNTNTFAYVNNDFRCIVSVDIDQIGNEEAPFLNRFEKHIISFEYLLNEELIKECNRIKSILDLLVKTDANFKGIYYDLQSLLINCNIDEIQALVYQAKKEGKKKGDMADYVFERIALTLPQDILVNMQLTKMKQKKPKEYKKIMEFYNKGEHSNISNFLQKTKNNKNIIYTFSNNLDEMKNINGINNPIVGVIDEKNIKTIQINSIKSENDLERQLDDFFNDDNSKICIVKLLPYEGKLMNYLKYFIENKEKDYENKPKKVFIFIVYMTRILKSKLNNKDELPLKEKIELTKKILDETLSNLSGYNQIFIDNLNGDEKLKIDKILTMKKSELFQKLINVEEELCINIYKSITYMKYNVIAPYRGINQENYVNEVLELICKNKRLQKLINECIFRESLNNDENIINKIFKDQNAFKEEDVEISLVIKRYLSKIYTTKLSLFYLVAEKEQFFSSLVSNAINQKIWGYQIIREREKERNDEEEEEINLNEDKTLVEIIAKSYLEKLVFDDGLKKVTEKPFSNKINIILGLNIPGVKPLLDQILKTSNENTINKFRNNENNLRNNLDEEEIEKEKKNYFEQLKTLNNSLINMLYKIQDLSNMTNINPEKKEQIYDLLINDYYTFFLTNNLNSKKNEKENEVEEGEEAKLLIIDNMDDNKAFLNLMTNLRDKKLSKYTKENENNNEVFEKFAININWVGAYKDEITILQQIFTKLSMKIPELNNQISEIINTEQVKYEISNRSPEYTSIVNETFFLSLDSILRIITSKEEIYEIPQDDFFDLINTNKDILQSAQELEANLILRSKEVFSLQEILKLINAFYLNKMASIENIKIIIQYFKNQTISINENKNNVVCDNLNNFYKFLFDKLGNMPTNKNFDFYKILGFVFLDEFTKIPYPEFRELLLQIILGNKNLIKNSAQLIKIILENIIDSNPCEISNNLSNLQEGEGLVKKLNDTNNNFLDEVIMNIFERKIMVFFESIPKLRSKELKEFFPKYYSENKNEKNKKATGIIFDISLDIFQETIQFLDTLSNQKGNSHLCKLYCIVFIKIYLSKLVSFIFEKWDELKNIDKIMSIIKKLKNKNFAKVIKIYIFKLFYKLMNNNYEQFQDYEFNKHGIDFKPEFEKGNKQKEIEIMLSFFFLPLEEDEYQKYLEESKLFIQNSNFDLNNKEIANLIARDGIDIFLCISINKIISNLGLYKYEEKETYKKFSQYAKSLFADKNKLKISKELCDLLDFFFDSKIYINKIKPKIPLENKKINQKIFEILLYGFRYCVQTLSNNYNEPTMFQSILSRNCMNIIDHSFIPGNDNKEDLHITSLESIEFHFKTFPDACGCYVCSCGFYYNIDPCGFPTTNRTFNCPDCGKKCGWDKKKVKGGAANHGMVVRPGHYRIFKDKAQKVGQMKRWNDPEENIPNLIMEDYIKKIIEPIKKSSHFGFNSISREYFENQNKKIRNLSNIGYRLLNLISYYHLFFTYCLGNISDQNLEKYLIKNMSILKIIETDWDKLKESLQKQNINSIQVFMNMIFKKLSKLIRECKCLTSNNDREIFEKQVEDLIAECIKNYPTYFKKYNEENQKQLELDVHSLKTYVSELVPPIKEIYPEKDFPLFNYFIYTSYKTEQDLLIRMDNKDKYPLLNQLIKGGASIRKLSYLPAFIDFTNYMIDNYSLKISREKAKERPLEKEEIVNEAEFTKKFENFIKSWNEIKSEAIKYKCRPEMPVKDLTIQDKLISFLMDGGELLNGMYLAAACQNFIDWQNAFLIPIADANAFNGILHNYVDNINREIPIQDSKPAQIVLIRERFNKSSYTDLNDVIYSFSERNIFNDNGTINYSDYNSFVYDYASIEEELGKIILPGVSKFQTKEELNFVAYWGEGFRGGNSKMLNNFYSKYPQKDLDEKEKEIIINYINKKNKEKMDKYNTKYDFKDFFGSIQILIFYLTEKNITKEDEKISAILQKAPNYLKLSDDCRDFFYDEGVDLPVEKMMNLFFFFEHLCFEYLADTLQPEYKQEIPDELKVKIIEKLLNKEKPFNPYITVKSLGAAIRRLISRYLAGKTEVADVDEKRNLAFELSREDLWEEKISKLEDLAEISGATIYEFNLTVGQAYALYNIIGEEDRNAIKNLAQK